MASTTVCLTPFYNSFIILLTYSIYTTIRYPTKYDVKNDHNWQIHLIRTRSLMKTADYTVHACYTLWKLYQEHTAVLIYRMLERKIKNKLNKKLPKGAGPKGGRGGSFSLSSYISQCSQTSRLDKKRKAFVHLLYFSFRPLSYIAKSSGDFLHFCQIISWKDPN